MDKPINVVVEIADGAVIDVRSDHANVRVLIADYDVGEWDDRRTLPNETDNPFQLIDKAADVDPDGTTLFLNTVPYTGE